jgi:hypothetical protein
MRGPQQVQQFLAITTAKMIRLGSQVLDLEKFLANVDIACEGLRPQ